MSDSMMISLLRKGQTGDQILQILDTLVEDITQANIQDCAEHYAAISMPILEEVEF